MIRPLRDRFLHFLQFWYFQKSEERNLWSVRWESEVLEENLQGSRCPCGEERAREADDEEEEEMLMRRELWKAEGFFKHGQK